MLSDVARALQQTRAKSWNSFVDVGSSILKPTNCPLHISLSIICKFQPCPPCSRPAPVHPCLSKQGSSTKPLRSTSGSRDGSGFRVLKSCGATIATRAGSMKSGKENVFRRAAGERWRCLRGAIRNSLTGPTSAITGQSRARTIIRGSWGCLSVCYFFLQTNKDARKSVQSHIPPTAVNVPPTKRNLPDITGEWRACMYRTQHPAPNKPVAKRNDNCRMPSSLGQSGQSVAYARCADEWLPSPSCGEEQTGNFLWTGHPTHAMFSLRSSL